VILSAGLSPAWQQILVFDGFRYGQVNRAVEAHWCGSGKVFNAGIAAHHLDRSSLLLAAVGGPPVRQIEDEFDGLGINYRWVRTASATRVCTTVLDRTTGEMTELVENGRPVTDAELQAFADAFAEEAARAEAIVLIGSLPAGAPVTYYRDLAAKTSCPLVLDFRGEELLATLEFAPYAVKPNREELAQTVGRPLDDDADLVHAMRQLNRRGAQWMVVTDGENPVWVTSTEQTYRLIPPPVDRLINPIACGDAMAATLAWATRDGRDILDAVRLAIAAAGENLRQLLPCRLDRGRVESRAEGVGVEEV